MFEILQGHRIEYEFSPTGKPVMVFLHEGLGSIAMWKDFPARCAARAGCDALVYSRYGYGNSDPFTTPLRPDYMHLEALTFLPQLLAKLSIRRPILFGHSDGASIALIHAAEFPVEAVIVLAPHLFVEELSLDGIRAMGPNPKLARYHRDADSTFEHWRDIWLHPEFRSWDIGDYVARIQAPILAIQGFDDEYGTMEHLDRIARLAPRTQLVKLEKCRHSPHRDQPDAVISAVAEFLAGLNTPNGKETSRVRAT